jgi:hypothetical protein
MSDKLRLALLYLLTISVLLVSTPASVYAEDYLYKGDAKYLGWEQADNKFQTCSGTILDRGDGRIEKNVDDSCAPPKGNIDREPPDRTPPMTFSSSFKAADTDAALRIMLSILNPMLCFSLL